MSIMNHSKSKRVDTVICFKPKSTKCNPNKKNILMGNLIILRCKIYSRLSGGRNGGKSHFSSFGNCTYNIYISLGKAHLAITTPATTASSLNYCTAMYSAFCCLLQNAATKRLRFCHKIFTSFQYILGQSSNHTSKP